MVGPGDAIDTNTMHNVDIVGSTEHHIVWPKPGFLQGPRDLADRHGVLLIFDQDVTGFRLSYAGAQGYFGVTLDLASYGKIVGCGGLLGCVAGREDLMDATNPDRKGRPDYAFINGTLHGEPLVGMIGDRGTVEGLRLLDGDLMLKIEFGGAAVQVRLKNVARFPDDGGISIKHGFGLRIPLSVRRLLDFWSVAGLPAPRNGQGLGRGSRDRQAGDGAGGTQVIGPLPLDTMPNCRRTSPVPTNCDNSR